MLSMLEGLCAQLMEAEAAERLGAENSERADNRSGYQSICQRKSRQHGDSGGLRRG